jgi:hypothetical protein
METISTELIMKHTLAAVIFLIAIPYGLYRGSIAWLIPFFGITHHVSVCAIGLVSIPMILSLLIGWWCAKGCWLPDN